MRKPKPVADTHVLRMTHDDMSVSYLQRATNVTARVTFTKTVETAHVFKSKSDARMFATLFYIYTRDWFGLLRHIHGIVHIEPEPYKDPK